MNDGKFCFTTGGPRRPPKRSDGTRRLTWKLRDVRRLEKLAYRLRCPFHSRHAHGWKAR